MIESEKKFDYQRYIMQRLLKILHQNKGVKLTEKTLAGLGRAGFRLVPSMD